MSSGSFNNVQLNNSSQEGVLLERVAEIESLEKLIDGALSIINLFKSELTDLESVLNHFLDHYYGSSADFFKNNGSADNNYPLIEDLDQAKKDIYEKIAKVCSKDAFHFSHDHISDVRSNLLKIEGYLTDGSEQSQSPQDMLSALVLEYSNLMQQICDLKEQKQVLLESPAYELKQEVMWINIKKSETISKIKEDITHRVNMPS
jgi:hypothetical protein